MRRNCVNTKTFPICVKLPNHNSMILVLGQHPTSGKQLRYATVIASESCITASCTASFKGNASCCFNLIQYIQFRNGFNDHFSSHSTLYDKIHEQEAIAYKKLPVQNYSAFQNEHKLDC